MGTAERGSLLGNSKSASDLPGPGNYTYEEGKFGSSSVKYKAPAYTFGGKQKRSDNNGLPGPGTYDSELQAVRERPLSYRMGNSQR
mmetsp:Transcript_21665/g.15930  ORF Transcript_21665/g.15930 Transcript_21665/m.15930 type:complete len:86 (-) Transcript_21665:612-869(-)